MLPSTIDPNKISLDPGECLLFKSRDGQKLMIPEIFNNSQVHRIGETHLERKGYHVIPRKKLSSKIVYLMKENFEFRKVCMNNSLAIPRFFEFDRKTSEVEAFIRINQSDVGFRPIVVRADGDEWSISVWNIRLREVLHFANANILSIDTLNGTVRIEKCDGVVDDVSYKELTLNPRPLQSHFDIVLDDQNRSFVRSVQSSRVIIQRQLFPNQIFCKTNGQIYTLANYPLDEGIKRHRDLREVEVYGSMNTIVLPEKDIIYSDKISIPRGKVYIKSGANYGQLGRLLMKGTSTSQVLVCGEVHEIPNTDLIYKRNIDRLKLSVTDEQTQFMIKCMEDQLLNKYRVEIRSLYNIKVHLSNPEVSKFFPFQPTWLISNHELTKEIPDLAEKYGIRTIGTQSKTNEEVIYGRMDVWTQDSIGSKAKGLSVPCLPYKSGEAGFKGPEIYIYKFYQPSGLDRKSFGKMGSAYERETRQELIALQVSRCASVTSMLTYSEGGNMLSGINHDGDRYIIVGKDSMRVTCGIFGKLKLADTESGLNELVKMAFAIDYGVTQENVFFVEQPGEFHLDMKMTLVGPKKVMLNSAVESMRVQRRDGTPVNSSGSVMKWVEEIQKWEDLTDFQLKEQGFEVVRVPGCFYDYSNKICIMNFFNMVQFRSKMEVNGTNMGIIALGCRDYMYQSLFMSILKECGLDDVNVEFLDYEATKKSLALCGGIACQLKALGNESEI